MRIKSDDSHKSMTNEYIKPDPYEPIIRRRKWEWAPHGGDSWQDNECQELVRKITYKWRKEYD